MLPSYLRSSGQSQLVDELQLLFQPTICQTYNKSVPNLVFSDNVLTMSYEGTDRSVILLNGFGVMLLPFLELCSLVNNISFHQKVGIKPAYQCFEVDVSFWHFSRPFPFTNNHSSKVKCFKTLFRLLSYHTVCVSRWVSSASAASLLVLW